MGKCVLSFVSNFDSKTTVSKLKKLLNGKQGDLVVSYSIEDQGSFFTVVMDYECGSKDMIYSVEIIVWDLEEDGVFQQEPILHVSYFLNLL